MTSSVKTVYKCDFCPKKLFTKKSMENHEKYCKNNPINHHACLGCTNLEKEILDESGHIVFTCKLFGDVMYSYVAEKKKLLTKYPASFEEAVKMPLECEGQNMTKDEYADFRKKDAVERWLKK